MACTFFGHRDCPISVKPRLLATLIDLIEHKGVTMFYVGNQGRFDAIVCSVLRELAEQYPQISYAVVLAYMPREGEGSATDTILPEGIETVPRRFAIPWRNRWMLGRSDYVVVYVTHSWGGAAQFAALARRKGKAICHLFDK